MDYKIGLLYGDGIGPEITKATEVVMKAAVKKHNLSVEFPVYPMGWEGIKEYNDPVPEVTKEGLKTCDAWVFAPHDSASYPEPHFSRANPSGTMRHYFDLFSNVRPAKTYPGVNSRVGEADVIVVRENSEGSLPDRNMYRGWGEFMPNPDMVILNCVFTRQATERVAHEAFKLALKRKKHLTIVHKANVIQWSYGLFRSVICEIGAKYYPEVKIDDFHIDAMTVHMVRRLKDFDVIVATNLFGDILSDLAGELTGSLGLGPAINTNATQCMAQAAHGSAPDIAGKNIANPVGLMLSAVMMFEWLSVNRNDKVFAEAADTMQKAILSTMEDGILTPDMGGSESTTGFTDAVVKRIVG
ncbi:isocitrate/isopropylmalate dehydrogenase family protein [Lacrimispora sp.]|uniref:isocitrate/isopropylmalate dehydrogenase family protein n=1 Tax=Lacrimispora sp. TaxID=2719234 RepID=UPI0034606F16